ncbi:MAG: AlkZ family DNA glycosylase [Polyangiaceae bacterium]|nr:AlkZ family DNA glycosylase [Polyangiaceae bacterium]
MTRTKPSIGCLRLGAQRIGHSELTTAAEVVAWLGAVQAQNYDAAKWAVGLRSAGSHVSERSIDQSLADGRMLRTHALRGTWHLVHRDDIRWLLALVGPRVIARATRRYHQLELDPSTFRRANRVIARALEKDGDLTRDELRTRLEHAGVSTEGQRLPHLLGRAELEGILSSGVPRGKTATYALLDQRVPLGRTRHEGHDAIAELARRYFQSRGPATLDDFVWWSGLGVAEARQGLEAAESTLNVETLGGQAYWRAKRVSAAATTRRVFLLPAFDEYLVGYRNRDAVLAPEHAARINAGGGLLEPCVVQGGRVIGVWRRAFARGSVVIDVELFAGSTLRPQRAIEAAARRFGAFLGREARVRAAKL